MSDDGGMVVSVYLADGEDAETWHDRIADLCRCRRHWWQFWRRGRTCSFLCISSRWEPFDDDEPQ